jgi:hypothetical protein
VNHVLVVVLNAESEMSRLIRAFADIGVLSATVVKTKGMGHYLTEDVPIGIFASSLASDSAKTNNYTIFSIVENDAILAAAIRTAHEIIGDFDRPGAGFLFSAPVQNLLGLAKPLPK